MNFLKRRMHISRVSRIIPLNNIEEVETVFGKQFIVKTKPCKVCQTVQPIDNFYAKAKNERKGKTAEELDVKDMEWMCISCCDDRKPRQKKENRNRETFVKFFSHG